MEKHIEELIQQLIATDEELRGYYEEHLDLERQLATYHRKLHLSAEQEIEKKQIQKRKLAGKDRMMVILEKHRAGVRAADAS